MVGEYSGSDGGRDSTSRAPAHRKSIAYNLPDSMPMPTKTCSDCGAEAKLALRTCPCGKKFLKAKKAPLKKAIKKDYKPRPMPTKTCPGCNKKNQVATVTCKVLFAHNITFAVPPKFLACSNQRCGSQCGHAFREKKPSPAWASEAVPGRGRGRPKTKLTEV